MRTPKGTSVISGFQWVSDSADAQIDALVHEFYGLTEGERL
jgi:hypothetical protein